jgi:hypothetical protein
MILLSEPLNFIFESSYSPAVSNIICSYLDLLATVMPKIQSKKRKQEDSNTTEDDTDVHIGAKSEYPLRLSYISKSVQTSLFACNKEIL